MLKELSSSEKWSRRHWLLSTLCTFVIYPYAVADFFSCLIMFTIFLILVDNLARFTNGVLIFFLIFNYSLIFQLMLFLQNKWWVIPNLLINFWWYFTSFKLIKLNQKLRSRMLVIKRNEGHPLKYSELLSVLHGSENLNLLDTILKEMIDRWPEQRKSSIIEYKIAKEKLSKHSIA